MAMDVSEQGRPLTILVVEDTPVNQLVATGLLARFGHRTDVAASGGEALAALETRDYDLVLMDVQMPEMDGLEATRRIRERWPQRPVRIVAMTANVEQEDVRRCRSAGMDAFLGKPILLDALAELLRETSSACLGALMSAPIAAPLLTRLLEQLGAGTVREIVDAFLAALAESLPTLHQGCRDHDRELLARTAHRLKGSALNLGIDDLGGSLAELELHAAEAEWGELQTLIGQIDVQTSATSERLVRDLGAL